MALLNFHELYLLTGIVLAALAVHVASRPSQRKRWTTAAFWAIAALLYLAGDEMSHRAAGALVLAMVALGLCRCVAPARPAAIDQAARQASADRLKNRLFLPPLIVPVTAVLGSLALPHLHTARWTVVQPNDAGVVSVSIGAILALVAALRCTREGLSAPLTEGGRILETFGWLLFLPQFLAAFSAVLLQLGVGTWLGSVAAHVIPAGSPFLAVAGYCLAMAAFTMCLGNAFAAFAVITSAIGLPFVVRLHHGNPAIMAAIGMLSGYCGTLMTPLAANFNLVPALLLELKDRNAVVKTQIPIGLSVLAANIILMWQCVYRF